MKRYAGVVLVFSLAWGVCGQGASIAHASSGDDPMATQAPSPASLIALLTSSSRQTRNQAALDLVKLDTKALPDVLKALQGPDAFIPDADTGLLFRSHYLAWILANIASDPARQLLKWCQAGPPLPEPSSAPPSSQGSSSSAKTPTPEQVLAKPIDRWTITARILSERSGEAEGLGALVDDQDPRVSRWALQILAETGARPERFATLSRRVEQGPDALLAMTVISLTSSIDPQPLRRWLIDHPEASIRALAAGALTDDSPETWDALSRALESDPEEDVRIAVISNFSKRRILSGRALAAIAARLQQDPDDLDDLLRMLENANPPDVVFKRHKDQVFDAIKASQTPLAYEQLLRRLAPFLSRQAELIAEAQALARNEDYEEAGDRLVMAAILSTPARPMDLNKVQHIWASFPLSERGALYADAKAQNLRNLAPLIVSDFRDGLKTRLRLEQGGPDRQRANREYEEARGDAASALTGLGSKPLSQLLASRGACQALEHAERLEVGKVPPRALETCLGHKLHVRPDVLVRRVAQLQAGNDDQAVGALVNMAIATRSPKRRQAYVRHLFGLPDIEAPTRRTVVLARCAMLSEAPSAKRAFQREISRAPRPWVGSTFEACPAAFADAPDLAFALLRRAKTLDELTDDLDREDVERLLQALVAERFTPPQRGAVKRLLLDLQASDEDREAFFPLVEAFGVDDPDIAAEIAKALVGEDGELAELAARAGMRSQDAALWTRSADWLARRSSADAVDEFVRSAALELHIATPGEETVEEVVVTGASFPPLPPFPAKPPANGLVAVFDVDPAIGLIGKPKATLGDVLRHLAAALVRIDPNYDWSLWSTPGGFALMTKTEQIQADGSPVPGPYRWKGVRSPPTSIEDYLARLFTAPPGYYRTIVFMVTDSPVFSPGGEPLPAMAKGGKIMPHSLNNMSFAGRYAYALVYAVAKKDGQAPAPYSDVSARMHLVKGKFVQELSKP